MLICRTEAEIEAFVSQYPNQHPLFFDYDGTLVYTEDIHWKLFHDALEELFGVDYPFSAHWEVTGLRYADIWSHLATRYGFDAFAPKVEAKKAELLAIRTSTVVRELERECFPYARKLTEQGRNEGRRIGCVTSNYLDTVMASLDFWGLSDFFSFVYSAAALEEDKVSFLASCSNVLVDQPIVFDDSPKVLSRLRKVTPDAILIGVGHPQSYTRLIEGGYCDAVIDVRENSIPFC